MRTHNGEIAIIGSWHDAATNERHNRYAATSDHDSSRTVEFYTLGAAEFYLWVIDERVASRKLRTGS